MVPVELGDEARVAGAVREAVQDLDATVGGEGHRLLGQRGEHALPAVVGMGHRVERLRAEKHLRPDRQPDRPQGVLPHEPPVVLGDSEHGGASGVGIELPGVVLLAPIVTENDLEEPSQRRGVLGGPGPPVHVRVSSASGRVLSEFVTATLAPPGGAVAPAPPATPRPAIECHLVDTVDAPAAPLGATGTPCVPVPAWPSPSPGCPRSPSRPPLPAGVRRRGIPPRCPGPGADRPGCRGRRRHHPAPARPGAVRPPGRACVAVAGAARRGRQRTGLRPVRQLRRPPAAAAAAPPATRVVVVEPPRPRAGGAPGPPCAGCRRLSRVTSPRRRRGHRRADRRGARAAPGRTLRHGGRGRGAGRVGGCRGGGAPPDPRAGARHGGGHGSRHRSVRARRAGRGCRRRRPSHRRLRRHHVGGARGVGFRRGVRPGRRRGPRRPTRRLRAGTQEEGCVPSPRGSSPAGSTSAAWCPARSWRGLRRPGRASPRSPERRVPCLPDECSPPRRAVRPWSTPDRVRDRRWSSSPARLGLPVGRRRVAAALRGPSWCRPPGDRARLRRGRSGRRQRAVAATAADVVVRAAGPDRRAARRRRSRWCCRSGRLRQASATAPSASLLLVRVGVRPGPLAELLVFTRAARASRWRSGRRRPRRPP